MDLPYDVLGVVGATLSAIGVIGYMARRAAHDRREQHFGQVQADLAQRLGEEFRSKREEHVTIPMRLASRFGIMPNEYEGLRTDLEKLAGPPVYEDDRNAPTYTPVRIYVAGGVAIILEESKPLKIRGVASRAEVVVNILRTYLHLQRVTKKGPTEDDRKVYEGVEFYEAPAKVQEEQREEPAPAPIQQ
ncbi:TPA: hypothetical protein HA297_06665 [Candidatus Woesearchaeota archaeon]|nr:hypothetical protein [Candidatus Woesearchaeota archaeon]HII89261.1 hypothetical protein [Candidatus Woesearchaeota archaeon]